MRKTRKGIYFIKNPVVAFWFRYIHKNLTLFEGGNYSEIESIIRKEIGYFEGRRFETIVGEFLTELNGKGALPFKFTKLGRWWNKDKEIDIVALNERTKEILFCECKWKDKVNAEKVLMELKEKAKFVKWNNEERKEYYSVVARSFKSRKMKPNLLLFDIKDFKT